MTSCEFPTEFLCGAATASYQIEGAPDSDGKGESIWDRFSHTRGKVKNGDTGDVACDHYNRFAEDIELMAELGLGSYRFSIAWPRIQPEGRGSPNGRGIAFYDRLVDGLLEAGIKPFPTLYHWDLPQTLQDAGGWPARELVDRFSEYAGIMADTLGDRVERWAIFNEPFIFTLLGYLTGEHAPGLKDWNAFLRASHNVNLAQGQTFRVLKQAMPQARIGSAFSMSPVEPASDCEADREAAERHHRFLNLWFLDPALHGRYPDALLTGLPRDVMDLREGDLEICRAPLDFIGINLYSRSIVQHSAQNPMLGSIPVSRHEGPTTDMGWEVWPDALHDMIMRIDRDYDRPAIEITENGCAYDDGPDATGRIRDDRRIAFLEGYLEAVARAIEQGADVRSYHAWSLLDNFEWAHGYEKRFGLIHVDFETGRRRIKDSARWYADVIRARGFEFG